VDAAEERGVRGVVTVGGFILPGVLKETFVAYSSGELFKRFLEAGAKKMPPGYITGPVGLIPAMAGERGMEGVCLLGAVSSPVDDKEASFRVLRILLRALGLGLRPLG